MKYVYIDGDDIGLRIERSLMVNDEDGLGSINDEVTKAIQDLTNSLMKQGCKIIFSGADGVIFKTVTLDVRELQSELVALGSFFSFSSGIGDSLREAFLALRYAKANGKNGAAIYGPGFSWIRNPSGVEEEEQTPAVDVLKAPPQA